jgi:serine/threonine protein kinase
MKALREAADPSPSGTLCRPSGDQATVAADLVGGPAAEPAGRLVAGRYRLRSLLGRGGMGSVWLAEDELLQRPVAVKQITPSDPVSEESGRMARVHALGEARAAARVDHGGTVRIHDVVRDDGCAWIVMEALSGRTLAAALHADGPLPVDQVIHVGLSLLDVLEATHRAGIVHRDVKPANVHLCEDGRVVLLDYGIARTMGSGSAVSSGLLAGSPAYISPEQFNSGEVGLTSDLFSLGATLFTAVEGRAAFDRGDLFATLTAVVVDTPGPLRRAGLLGPVIEGLLAKEPDRRWSIGRARAVLQAIRPERPAPTNDHRQTAERGERALAYALAAQPSSRAAASHSGADVATQRSSTPPVKAPSTIASIASARRTRTAAGEASATRPVTVRVRTVVVRSGTPSRRTTAF